MKPNSKTYYLISFSFIKLGSTTAERAPAFCLCHGRKGHFWFQGSCASHREREKAKLPPNEVGNSTDFGETKNCETQEDPNVNWLPPHKPIALAF